MRKLRLRKKALLKGTQLASGKAGTKPKLPDSRAVLFLCTCWPHALSSLAGGSPPPPAPEPTVGLKKYGNLVPRSQYTQDHSKGWKWDFPVARYRLWGKDWITLKKKDVFLGNNCYILIISTSCSENLEKMSHCARPVTPSLWTIQ